MYTWYAITYIDLESLIREFEVLADIYSRSDYRAMCRPPSPGHCWVGGERTDRTGRTQVQTKRYDEVDFDGGHPSLRLALPVVAWGK